LEDLAVRFAQQQTETEVPLKPNSITSEKNVILTLTAVRAANLTRQNCPPPNSDQEMVHLPFLFNMGHPVDGKT
jgi:hypothetical protein